MVDVNTKRKVLIIEDDEQWQKEIAHLFEMRGFEAVIAEDLEPTKKALATGHFDIATVGMDLKGHQLGPTLIEFIRNEYPNIACIIISGSMETFWQIDDLRDEHNVAFVHKHELTPARLEKAIEKAQGALELQKGQVLDERILEEYQQGLSKLELNLARRKTILFQHRQNLSVVEEQAAKFGIAVPINLVNEIEEFKQRIVDTEKEIEKIEQEILETKRKMTQLREQSDKSSNVDPASH